MRLHRLFLISLVSAVGSIACDDPSGPETDTSSLALDQATLTLTEIFAEATASAVVRDANGAVVSGAEIAWSVGDSSVARLVEPGRVMGWSHGETYLVAEWSGARDSALVQVTAEARSIRVGPDRVETVPGARVTVRWVVADGAAVPVEQGYWADVTRYQPSVADTTVARWDTDARALVAVRPGTTALSLAFGGITREIPVVVRDQALRFTNVEAGVHQTCGLTAEGELWCWGEGYPSGMPGANGPVRWGGEGLFQDMALGDSHGCALTTAGGTRCWGAVWGAGHEPDDRCESIPCAWTPGAVGGTVFERLHRAGPSTTCGLTADARAFCWGEHPGDGSESSGLPVEVAGGLTWTDLAGGPGWVCGLSTASDLWCWGGVGQGVYGGLEPTRMDSPFVTATPSALAGADGHTCFLTADEWPAWCWGGNASGQLGGNSLEDQSLPSPVTAGPSFERLSVGWRDESRPDAHTCGIEADGSLWCWGANYAGQLGLGHRDSPPRWGTCRGFGCAREPMAVLPGRRWADVAAGRAFTCAVEDTGDTYCWGRWASWSGTRPPTDVLDPAPVLGTQAAHFPSGPQ